MNEIDRKLLYKSEIHGVTHNERVSVFALAIGILEKVNDEDLKILLEASKYHDIGRTNDEIDNRHGRRSSEMFDKYKIGQDLSDEDKKILKTVSICHSLNDGAFNRVASREGVQDIERCKRLVDIFKDADGLDRVRIRDLDVKYLRTDSAKRMELCAKELYRNYIINILKIVKKENSEKIFLKLPEYSSCQGFIEKSGFPPEQLEEIREFIEEVLDQYKNIAGAKIKNNPIKKNEQERVILEKGTLIHGADAFDSAKLKKIAKGGILASELALGCLEEYGETYYCASFFRIKEEMRIEDFKRSPDHRLPMNSLSQAVAFIINPSADLAVLTDNDAYNEQNADKISGLLINKKTAPVSKYLSQEHRGEVAAIPVGIPSNFFSGIMIGDKVLEHEEKTDELKELFPHCYITTRFGDLIYDPNVKNEEIQKLMIEKAKIRVSANEAERGIITTYWNEQNSNAKEDLLKQITDKQAMIEVLSDLLKTLQKEVDANKDIKG